VTCKKGGGEPRDSQAEMGGEGTQKVDHFKTASDSCQFGFLRPVFQRSPQSRLGERELVVWRRSRAGLSLLVLMFP